MTELTGIGARLKEAREAQGLAIDEVAQQLKFAPRQIESLEHERFDRLPGPTIARGMVRNYARLLKLDPEPLIERMAPQAEKAPEPRPTPERFRQSVPFSDGGKRSSFIYAGFSVGLLALVGALAYEWHQQKAAPEFVAPASERADASATPAPPLAAAAPVAAPPIAAPPITSPKGEPPPSPPVVEQRKPEPPKPEVMKAAIEKPAVDKAAAGIHQIVVRCEEEAWVEVKDGSGRMLIATLNPAGTERALRGRPPFEIVIGNAASVRLTYDGKPVDLRPYTKVEVARLTLK